MLGLLWCVYTVAVGSAATWYQSRHAQAPAPERRTRGRAELTTSARGCLVRVGWVQLANMMMW
jgi:hypothetical protein